MEQKARCSCGSLVVTVSGPPTAVVACHCLECQRRTGSVLGVGAYYADSDVVVTGERQAFSRPAESGETFTAYFCPKCGTSVYWKIEEEPARVGVAVGAFADPAFQSPVRSVWEQSRHAWVQVPSAQQHFQKGRDSGPGKAVR